MDPVTMAIIGAGTGAIMNKDDPMKGALLGAAGGAFAGPALGAAAGSAGVGAAAGTAAENAMFMTAPFGSIGSGGIAATNGMPTIGAGLSGAMNSMASPGNMAKMGMSMMNQNQQRPMAPPAAAPMMRPQMPSGPVSPPMMAQREELYPFGGGGYSRYLGR